MIEVCVANQPRIHYANINEASSKVRLARVRRI